MWFRSLIEVVDYLLRPKGVCKQDLVRVDFWFRSLIEGVDYLLRPKGVYKQDLVWVESMVDRFSDRAVVRVSITGFRRRWLDSSVKAVFFFLLFSYTVIYYSKT